MANSPDALGDGRGFLRVGDQTGGVRDLLQGRDHDVVGDRLRLHEAERETILRDIGDARGDRFAVAREGDRQAGQADRAGVGAGHAEKRMGEFGAACADQADETDDLAGAHGQIHIRIFALARQAGGFDDDRRVADVAGGDGLVEPLTRHQFRQPRLCHARGVEYADQPPVAENGDAARHVEHFREPMAHENHGDAGRG